jgi:hypothetical protein
MNCQRFESVVSELARGRMMAVEQRDEALAHCNVCVLEAFRTRHVAATPLPSRRSNATYWLVAVAAMLLIAITVVALRWNAGRVDQPQQAVKQEQPQPQQENNKPAEELAVNVSDNSDSLPVRPKPPKRIHRTTLRRPTNVPAVNVANSEIATDFIPLRYTSAASLQDGGQIVRVELPRSALANFGLPVNMDRYNERVKADVLVGVDGLAHAIRFVQ